MPSSYTDAETGKNHRHDLLPDKTVLVFSHPLKIRRGSATNRTLADGSRRAPLFPGETQTAGLGGILETPF